MHDGRVQGDERNHPFRAFKAVLWAFLGIRKGAASQADLATLKLWQVVVAGLIGAAIFVSVILILVKWITS